MLQDIGEGRFDNHYFEHDPKPGDAVFAFQDGTLLAQVGEENVVTLPTFGEAGLPAAGYLYLFSIDDTEFFLQTESIDAFGPYDFVPLTDMRWLRPKDLRYAIQVARQLSLWYEHNRYCGRCGTPTEPDHIERMLRCPNCGNMIYPKISPGIIVGIIDGDKLLVTRYNHSKPGAWALVAGFTEIGETSEETVKREVMEEVGLHVKNTTYFTNQPWPRSATLLTGFFAELDGSPDVTVDHSELTEAVWLSPDELPYEPHAYSMTRTMMAYFADNHDQRERLIH